MYATRTIYANLQGYLVIVPSIVAWVGPNLTHIDEELALALTVTGTSTHTSLRMMLQPCVWFVSVLSAGVASAANIINDYFDFRAGTDTLASCPDKPLVLASVTPEAALLVATSCYLLLLFMCSWLRPHGLRETISTSAVITFLYTPLLKKVPLVKNAAVGAIVALAVIVGALAAASGSYAMVDVLARALLPATVTFHLIMFREIFMDIQGVAGDRTSGVRTLPVVLGVKPTLYLAYGVLISCGAAAYSLRAGAATWPTAYCLCMTACLGTLFSLALRAQQLQLKPAYVSWMIDITMLPISIGLIGCCM
eukprot:jgi/Mesvir1/24803/Mv22056-RA.1